jgi:hypothetical protein
MRIRALVGATIAFLACGAAYAGPPQALPVPALGDVGLVMLGLGLVGCGVTALRRGRKL